MTTRNILFAVVSAHRSFQILSAAKDVLEQDSLSQVRNAAFHRVPFRQTLQIGAEHFSKEYLILTQLPMQVQGPCTPITRRNGRSGAHILEENFIHKERIGMTPWSGEPVKPIKQNLKRQARDLRSKQCQSICVFQMCDKYGNSRRAQCHLCPLKTCFLHQMQTRSMRYQVSQEAK